MLRRARVAFNRARGFSSSFLKTRLHETFVKSTSQSDVVVVGASVMDMIAYVPRLPTTGETLHGTSFQTGFGGKGANQAVAAAKLGSQVSMISKVGADSNGTSTLENFKAQGIDASFVGCSAEASTGVAPIAVDNDGNNAIIVVMGANNLLSLQDVKEATPLIASAKVMLCQLEISLETTLEALRVAREHRVTTVLNTAPAPESGLPDEFFQVVDIVCPNQPELAMLTSMPTGTVEEATAAAKVLLQKGASEVIVTMGSDGVLVLGQAIETVHFPATGDEAVDTVGAGDAFMGAFAHFYSHSMPLLEAVERANIVSGASVTKKGTQTSFASRDELPDLLFDGEKKRPSAGGSAATSDMEEPFDIETWRRNRHKLAALRRTGTTVGSS